MTELQTKGVGTIKPTHKCKQAWKKYIDNAIKSYSFHEAKCSVIYMFPDGNQMIEEYDTLTKTLKCKTSFPYMRSKMEATSSDYFKRNKIHSYTLGH
ncbi:hypothetical protein MXB_4497 [Myxobolus squamalis]|nr:hypothetical protein MXB_4497 [Myxobolus squamalis]